MRCIDGRRLTRSTLAPAPRSSHRSGSDPSSSCTLRSRSREEFEYELLDTGVFNENRYFDVFVEYAKGGPDDVLVRITVHNRGPEAARLRVLPTLWFRNTWSWGVDDRKPSMRQSGPGAIEASHHDLGTYVLRCDGTPELLFTENESNASRLWNQPNPTPYVKDAFHAYVVSGHHDAVNPGHTGTKAAAHYLLDVPAGGSQTVRLRLSAGLTGKAFADFGQVFDRRLEEANEFYARITPQTLNEDQRRVHRQALAGMLWSKQFYYFDLEQWLNEHQSHPLLETARPGVRNTEWFHMLNADVISMPDKWEYPWYAAWDLAFHTVSLALVDFDFAKDQLLLMLRNLYVHPNGQIPAYEWNFSDVNPPVHAWATLSPGGHVSARCRRTPARVRGTQKFQDDPDWRELILFHEYSTATTGLASVRVTRRDGPVSSQVFSISSADWTPRPSSRPNATPWPPSWQGTSRRTANQIMMRTQ